MRQFLKSPGFAITAVVILGLGIGFNTAIFNLINGVLLRPLPYPEPNRLMEIFQPFKNFEWTDLDYPDYKDFCTEQNGFESLAVVHISTFDLTARGEAQRLSGFYASASFFDVLRTRFLLGRPFNEQEDRPGGPLVVVINERIWKRLFGSNPGIIGMDVTLNDRVFQIVGVVSADADEWASESDLFVPVSSMPGKWSMHRDDHVFACYGRLQKGIDRSHAEQTLKVISTRLVGEYPSTNSGYGVRVVPLLDAIVNDYSLTLWLLAAAVASLLLIAGANTATLFLMKGLVRWREMNIRAALGATRLQLLAHLLFENTVVAALGGIFGLLLSVGLTEIIKSLTHQENLGRFQEIHLDASALFFIFCITLLVAVIFGSLPAWSSSKTGLDQLLREGGGKGATGGPRRQRIRSLLVTGQISIACLLVIQAGLIARSLFAVEQVPLGFNPDHVLTALIELPSGKYASDRARCFTFFRTMLQKVRQLPGVTAAAANSNIPFNLDWSDPEPFGVPGLPPPRAGQEPVLERQAITPGYFQALKIPLTVGRDFNEQDEQSGQRVIIIDETIAQRYFSGQDPIGKQIHEIYDSRQQTGSKNEPYTIIGVAKHVYHDSPDVQQTVFQAYYTYFFPRYGTLVIRTENDPRSLIPDLRRVIASIDPDIPITKVMTFHERIAKRSVTRRMAVIVVGFLSAVALLLSVVGIYGVVAYAVSQRTKEVGIRVALGAVSFDVVTLVVSQGLKLASVGVALGILLTLVLSRLAENVLYGLSGWDPATLAFGALVLFFVTLLATLPPSLRAIRISPATALRD